MLKEEIMNVRNQLNEMIEKGEKEEVIYKISKKLDELIMQYYAENVEEIG